jgi:uncharacterized phage protein gp47/JayE
VLGQKLNLLPYAALVSWVNYLGVTLKGPVAAAVTVTINLEEALAEDFVIPAGTRFITEQGLGFLIDEEAIIQAGGTTINVDVTCEVKGTTGNVPEYEINNVYQLLPYIKEVYNTLPAAGGYDTELDADALERGRQIIKHLSRAVHAADYEQLAIAVSGISRAKAIESVGKVTLYLLSEDGQPANSALINNVLTFINPKRPQAIEIEVLPAEFKDVDITVNIKLLAGYSLTTVTSLISTKLQSKLSPLTWTWGRKVSISEIFAFVEEVQGIDYVDELLIPSANILLQPQELAKRGDLIVYAV